MASIHSLRVSPHFDMSASSSGLLGPIPHGSPDDLAIAAAVALDALPCPANSVGKDLKMVPDFALCVLQFDQFIRRHVLIHTKTSELTVLASGSTWALESDEAGFGMLAPVNDGEFDVDECQFVSNVFASCMYEDIDSQLFVVSTSPDGTESSISWESEVLRRTDCTLSWPIGQLQAKLSVEVGVLARQRAASRIWWRLSDIHRACKLNILRKQNKPSSLWVQKMFVAWEKGLCRMGLSSVLARGFFHKDDSVDLGKERFSAWPVGSSVALIALLARMAWCGTQCGGLKASADKDVITSFLASLVRACSGQPWSLNLFLEGQEEWHPPMLMDGRQPFILPVAANNGVNCSQLLCCT